MTTRTIEHNGKTYRELDVGEMVTIEIPRDSAQYMATSCWSGCWTKPIVAACALALKPAVPTLRPEILEELRRRATDSEMMHLGLVQDDDVYTELVTYLDYCATLVEAADES